MVYEIEFTAAGPFQVIVTTSGVATLAEMVAGRHHILDDPRWRPDMNVLLDHSGLDGSGLTASDVSAMAKSADRAAPERAPATSRSSLRLRWVSDSADV